MSRESSKFISPEDQAAADDRADDLWLSQLYKMIDNGDLGDAAAAAYRLWQHLTCYIAEDVGGRGRWTPEDLARDARQFAENQQGFDRSLARRSGKQLGETYEEHAIRRRTEDAA